MLFTLHAERIEFGKQVCCNMLDAFLIYLPKYFQQNSMCIISFSEHVKLQDHNAMEEVSKKKANICARH